MTSSPETPRVSVAHIDKGINPTAHVAIIKVIITEMVTTAKGTLILDWRPRLVPLGALLVSVRDLEDARFVERFA
jgi:hypothetical protein